LPENEKIRPVSGPDFSARQKSLAEFAARRPRIVFHPFFAAACTSRKILCAGLGPAELASADPTADVGPECVFTHFMRENARVEAKSLLSKTGGALF